MAFEGSEQFAASTKENVLYDQSEPPMSFPPSQFSILVKVSTKMRKIKKQKSKEDDLLVVLKTSNASKEKKMLEKM